MSRTCVTDLGRLVDPGERDEFILDGILHRLYEFWNSPFNNGDFEYEVKNLMAASLGADMDEIQKCLFILSVRGLVWRDEDATRCKITIEGRKYVRSLPMALLRELGLVERL